MESYLKEVSDLSTIEKGSVVRRQGNGKNQQGHYVRPADEGEGLIVAEVLDLSTGEYIAEAGILRPTDGDTFYVHQSRFGQDAEKTQSALEVVKSWSLFEKSPALHQDILAFVQAAFSPEQVLAWKRNDELKNLFVPIQQKFKIGRFEEKIDYDKVREERFGEQLVALHSGKHMTYVAFIPREGSHKPMFYSIGTKPHLETLKNLEREPFAFRPNHGGHIKCVIEEAGEQKQFLVDAGSNDLGAGMHTSVAIAEMVVEALLELYPDHAYKPLPGREAFGLQQSY